MKNSILIFLFLSFTQVLTAQYNSIEERLFELPDVQFEAIETPYGYQAGYELKIKQPIDHQNPEKGYFYQRVFLSHKSFDAPTVIVTEGYNRGSNRMYELSRLLAANQLDVEHRFYGQSIPEPMDYSYLNLEQATADLHRINELFKQLYPNKWVSTGISKGGQTTIFYRYFYPDDVAVSVPYVAPLNLEFEEKRIYAFLDTVGADDCRKKLKDLQIRLLKERKTVLPLIKWYSKGANLNYTYLSMEEAFEFAILEFPFSFWQWGGNCADIPDAKASLDEALDYLLSVSGIGFFSDRDMTAYASHYYQAAAQMGYYGYETAEFKGLLKALPTDKNPHAAFTPNKMKVTFDNSLPLKVAQWVKEKGHQFIYINGALDTWSATSVPPSDKVDALWFSLEGKDHAGARIKNMTAAEKAKMIGKLEEWLVLEID